MQAQISEEYDRMVASVLEPEHAKAVREEMLEDQEPVSDPKLGLRSLHTMKLALGDYLEGEAQPPARVHRGEFKGYSDVLANDTLGDCGPAMAVHGTQGINHAVGNTIPPFTAPDTVTFYSEESGYNPQDPSTDQGTDNAVMIKKWEDVGILCKATNTRHKILGSLFVDPNNEVQNKIAIYEFAVLFRAVNLPVSAQGQNRWSVVGDGQTGDSAPGSWGGHDIPFMAYDESDYDADSWGQWIPVDQAFDSIYAMQGFVVLSREMVNRKGVSPSGVNYTRLTQDFQKLIGGGDAS